MAHSEEEMQTASKVVSISFFYRCACLFVHMKVPLGIMFHNEAKIIDMCHILNALDHYVPAKKCTKVISDDETGEEFEVDDTKVFGIKISL